MGMCIECKKEITLKAGEKVCPKCGQYPYRCWDCNQKINDEGAIECPSCHYFFCPDCGVCGKECSLSFITNGLYKKYPEVSKRAIADIISTILENKNNPPMKLCPKGVPISYAKSRLRNLALKIKGFNIKKNGSDHKKFIEVYEKIDAFPIDKVWTITSEREDGHYGQELRDASFMAVCLGIAKVEYEQIKDKQDKVISLCQKFTRVTADICEIDGKVIVDMENLTNKKCHKCGGRYPTTTTECPTCIYKKGENKGQHFPLEEVISTVNFCQLARNKFIPKKELKNGISRNS